MDFNTVSHDSTGNQSAETEIKKLQDEIIRLKGFENIVNGFMEHESICVGVFQKVPPKVVFINRGLELRTGYSREEILNFSQSDFENILHPECREEFFQRYYKRLRGEDVQNSYEFKLMRKDGTYLSLQAFVYRIDYNNEPSIVITMVDITKMRETEKALEESRESYRLLFNKTPVSIIYFDKELHINHFNDKCLEMFQTEREKLAKLDLRTLTDKSVIPCFEAAINGDNGIYKGHYRTTTSNAGIVISMKTEPLLNDAGEVTGGVAIIEDITRAYETEEALHRSEEKFKEMIDKSPLPIAVVDVNDRIIYNNIQCLKLFGFEINNSGDILAWWNSAYPDPSYRAQVSEDWYSGYKIHQKKREIYGPKEYRVTCSDGIVRDIEFHVVPVGENSLVIMNDMTRHRKAEAELLKTKKIESLGIMAGGIAHDFNNILMAIIGNLNLVKLDITEGHRSHNLLDNIEKAAWRARDLTQQLLTFSRGGEPVKKITSIRKILEESVPIVLDGAEIKPEFTIQDNLHDAEIDEGQISQVIQNLVLNARESMPEGGVLTISAENCRFDGPEGLVYPGDYIRIIVEDTGKGIAPSIIPNIFDPFFTTKKTGAGLGLSVSYSIVKKHNGVIKVSSVEGAGSVFEVFLPAVSYRNNGNENSGTVPKTAAGRILVMDDEEIILDILKKMLTRMGYDVIVSKCGEETFSLYRENLDNGFPVDCVIMDLTIQGGMGGKETLALLKEYDPEVTAIVSSGYSNDPVMSRYEQYGFAGVTAKPYSFDDLRSEIERVMLKNKKH